MTKFTAVRPPPRPKAELLFNSTAVQYSSKEVPEVVTEYDLRGEKECPSPQIHKHARTAHRHMAQTHKFPPFLFLSIHSLSKSITAIPLHALAGVFMGFFLMDAIFQKHNRKFYLFLSLFFPVCLHGLYDLILFSKSISDYYIYILLIIFLIRALFIFSKERKAQIINKTKKRKYIPKNSDIFLIVFVTFFILFGTNYFFDYAIYR